MFWFFIIFALVIWMVITLVYFVAFPHKNMGLAWTWWGISTGSIIIVAVVVWATVWRPHVRRRGKKEVPLEESASERYARLAHDAKTDPVCQTARAECLERTIAQKRSNDATRARLTERVAEGQATEAEKDLLRRMPIAQDVKQIDACSKESDTNLCVEKVIDACEASLESSQSKDVVDQFHAFRTKHEAAEVLALCRTQAGPKA
jgi:FtsZ-interacting cell division protein ZipA